jgi:outer membrane protein insertion porin family
MKDMKRLLLILMLGAVCGFAQTGPAQKKATTSASKAPAARWPIESLRVEGTHSYTPEQVLAVAGVKVGQMAGRPEFDAARDRLVACGAFETVGYKFTPSATGKGYAAVFQVTEVEQVYPVEFEDLHVSELELRGVLKSKDPLFTAGKLPATQPVLDRYVKWVQEFLAAKGQPEKIMGSVTPLSPNEFAIVFRPSRPLPAVALVTFRGNGVIPQNVLHDAVAGAAIGMPYTEDRFREVLYSSIRPLYEGRGRVRVRFPEIRTEPDKNVKGLHVFVTVEEGQSYTLGKIGVDGPTPLDPFTLLKAGDFKSGDVANYDKVNDGLEKMRKMVWHAGFLEAKVTADKHIDDGEQKVDLTVRVDSGPQFTMGRLTIAGLDLEGEAEIKRIWTLKEGKPFNPEYPDFFLNSVKQQGLFDNLANTHADVKLDNKNHVADVTLRFAGGKPEAKPGRGGRGRGLYF